MFNSLIVESTHTNALRKEGEEEIYRCDSSAGDHISVSVTDGQIVFRCAYLPGEDPMGGFFTAAVELEELIEALQQQKEIKIHAIPFHP